MHMKSAVLALALGCVIISLGCLTDRTAADDQGREANTPHQIAATPPMGWNSYDCYGSAVVEAEIIANADYMARHLANYGWEYVVVDYCWSHPSPGAVSDPDLEEGQDGSLTPMLAMDEYGRLLPAPERFPLSVGGKGFKPLADYVHSKGLKFGIHVMRGIPRQAVARNLPVLGTKVRAKDIADRESICTWLNHMYGVDMKKPGAQAYYDSLFQLYAQWGVDYVKVDDMIAGSLGFYHTEEIEAIRLAIKKCGRPIVLSFSPGPAPLDKAEHLQEYANLWRISSDFWDVWGKVKDQFSLCRKWAPHSGPGHWPDADMLPLGRLALRGPKGPPNRQSRLTPDEQITLMSLWAIFRSPLMFGGNLPSNDEFTLSLLTNEEVLAVNQNSTGNRELFKRGDHIGWIANVPGSEDKYLALFNLSDSEDPAKISVSFEQLGLSYSCQVKDLWKKRFIGSYENEFAPAIRPHAAGLYRIRAN